MTHRKEGLLIMEQIILIRHCQATGQDTEAPLTESGLNQAKVLADFLIQEKLNGTVISSPFKRAIQSITPFTQMTELNLVQDERLAERRLAEQPLANWKDLLRQTFTDPDLAFEGGESSREALSRALDVIEAYASTQDSLILVTHGNLMSLILQHFDDHHGFDTWQSLTNPDVYVIRNITGEPAVSRMWK